MIVMHAPLDLDQLQTFIMIADTGSFTRAADEVHRTQSAVSMQMRRLEERIDPIIGQHDKGRRSVGFRRACVCSGERQKQIT